METQYKKGDKVFDLTIGWGEVIDIDNVPGEKYPIRVKFDIDTEQSYTSEGYLYSDYKTQVLSFTAYTAIHGGAVFERPVLKGKVVYWVEDDIVRSGLYENYIPGSKYHIIKNTAGVELYVRGLDILDENPLNVKQNQ